MYNEKMKKECENKWVFEGNLLNTLPESLISKEGENEFDDFFLISSLIYNDIKDLHFLWLLIVDHVSEPIIKDGKEELTYHNGEYAGIRQHIIRLFLGTINEFLVFLSKHRETIEGEKFLKIKSELLEEEKNIWENLYNLATAKNEGKLDPVFQFLHDIRSNVAFHYWDSKVPRGFKKFFYENGPSIYNRRAHYALGESMRSTRFFYGDAAASAYINVVAEKHGFATNDLEKLILEDIMGNFNRVIRSLLLLYIRSKKSKNKKWS